MENTFIDRVREEIVEVEKRHALLKALEAQYDPAAIAEVEEVVGKKAKKVVKEYTLAELKEEVRNMKAEDPELTSSQCAKALGVSTYRVNNVW